jgi:glucokinase
MQRIDDYIKQNREDMLSLAGSIEELKLDLASHQERELEIHDIDQSKFVSIEGNLLALSDGLANIQSRLEERLEEKVPAAEKVITEPEMPGKLPTAE